MDGFGYGIFLDDVRHDFTKNALLHITCATVLVNSPPLFPERRLSFYSPTPTPKGRLPLFEISDEVEISMVLEVRPPEKGYLKPPKGGHL